MNMKKIIILFISFLAIYSCSDKEDPIGKWGDNIKLSQKVVNFTAEQNSTVVTTQGTWWWINGIGLNDDWNYDLNEIDTTKDNFVIEEDDFKIERKNTTEIHISMNPNQTGLERVLLIGLQAGNYGDGIMVIQAAD